MATFTNNSQAVSTTEWSIPRDASYDSAQPQTADEDVQVWLKVDTLAVGDIFQLALYEKVNGSAQLKRVLAEFTGKQDAGAYVSPVFRLGEGWDFTLLKVAGTDRTIDWSLRRVAI